MMSSKLKINYWTLALMLLLFPFYKPYYISIVGLMPFVNQFLFAISLLMICLVLVLRLPTIYIYKGYSFLIVFYSTIIYSTYINGGINSEVITFLSFVIGFSLLTHFCLDNKKRFEAFLSVFYYYTLIYLVLNFLIMILFPDGIPSITSNLNFPLYLFGNTNSVIKMILPGLCFSCLYDLIKYKKLRVITKLMLLLGLLTLLKTWSVTSFIGLLLFIFIALNPIKILSLNLYYFATLLLTIFTTYIITFVGLSGGFLGSILDVFGKNLTFSGRDALWMNAILSLNENLWFGYGIQDSEFIWQYIGNRFGAHNYLIDIAFRGGIISVFILVFYLIIIGLKQRGFPDNKVKKVIFGSVSAYFVMWISEPFISTEYLMFTIIFVLLPRIDIINSYYEEN